MPGRTLLVVGNDPSKVSVSVASLFSVRGFTHIAIAGTKASQLSEDEDTVLDAVQERGYSCRVETFSYSNGKLETLRDALDRVKGFGALECVLCSAPFHADLAMLNICADWALPVLQDAPSDASPTFMMNTEASGESLADVRGREEGEKVHVVSLALNDNIIPSKRRLRPERVAAKVWELYKQPKGKWEHVVSFGNEVYR